MREDAGIQRCLEFAKSLNRDLGWHVPEAVLLEYARAIAQSDQLSDVQCCQALRHYHADHWRVQALSDENNPGYEQAWVELSQSVGRLVSHRLGQNGLKVQRADVVQEITQEAICHIIAGLRTFRYNSHVHTWVYSVVAHSLAQYFRSQAASKRGAKAETHSLEALNDRGEVVYDTHSTNPDDLVLDRTLIALVGQVLNEQPDERVGLVFQLWVFDEQPLRAIGEKLSLSPARVHGLCKQASTLLRQHPAVLEWLRSIEFNSRIDA